MTRWVAMFEDKPQDASGWVRRDHEQDHVAYLAAHSDRIRIAGGLGEAPGGAFVGGLWVIEADSREDAIRLVEGDPYFRLGLRESYRLLAWGKAPCYGDVVL